MRYYVVQVKTGGEEKYLKLARRLLLENVTNPDNIAKLIWPRRRLRIRKSGKERDSLKSIFPGYVFLEADELDPHIYWILRKTNGFYKFLKNNQNVEALSGRDLQLLSHFLSFGEVIEKSTAYFDENKRIQVTEGALKGLEGKIVKVDRRKQRAKVQLSLYDSSFLIDFGFEVLQQLEDHEKHKT